MAALALLPSSPVAFPDPEQALDDPDGLLAAGGGLSIDWLLEAYARGIFPWFSESDPHILWWSPGRRAVFVPGEMHVSRSLRKTLRKTVFEFTLDTAFEAVVRACAGPRRNADGTWITSDMIEAYVGLHVAGFAHSIEVKEHGRLVGGLYGVSLGRMFFGESMFSHRPSASKAALYVLQRQLKLWDFTLFDCQIMNPHLASLGVKEISRTEYLHQLAANPLAVTHPGDWQLDRELCGESQKMLQHDLAEPPQTSKVTADSNANTGIERGQLNNDAR